MTITITELNDTNAEKIVSAYLDHIDNGSDLPTVDYQVGYDYEQNHRFHARCYKTAKTLRPNAVFEDMLVELPF